jgi:hypothetical protein
MFLNQEEMKSYGYNTEYGHLLVGRFGISLKRGGIELESWVSFILSFVYIIRNERINTMIMIYIKGIKQKTMDNQEVEEIEYEGDYYTGSGIPL